MKKIYLIIFCFFCVYVGHAQGIYQFYGVTPFGGNENGGVIYTTDSAGSNFRVRYDYRINPNPGAGPWYTKLAEYNGKFYGMTKQGGSNNLGVIFEFDPITNIYAKKIDFIGGNGSSPYGSLVMVGSKFYGMTSAGGTGTYGVLFEWDPSTNVEVVKYNFTFSGASQPWGNVTALGNVLYGMTNTGGTGNGGTIFQFDLTTNIFTLKFSFTSANGLNPQGNLVYKNGLFYGNTYQGGTNNRGVIFQWDPVTNIFTRRFQFATSDNGNNPTASMVDYNDKFYGMTRDGGSGSGGVLYEWDPLTGTYTRKVEISKDNAGSYGTGELTFQNGKFYGMLSLGRNIQPLTLGSIFEWDPATNVYTTKFTFNDWTGSAPCGTLTISGSKMFAVTQASGADYGGTIFDWDPATNIFTKRVDLGGKDDKNPNGNLAYFNGKLYGVTSKGGVNGCGTIFEWDPATTTETRKYNFINPDGRYPHSNLTLYNNQFYGMTSFGGLQDSGVVFQWDPATNVYTKRADLTTATGIIPYGDLVVYNNKLYGMTSGSDNTRLGTIFEFDPATNILTKKINFGGASGYHPFGSLALFNGKFYGTCSEGGTAFQGTIFEWDPVTNIISTKYNFNNTSLNPTGSFPYCTLALYNNLFYGTAAVGANSRGVIFQFDPVTAVYTDRYDFDCATNCTPYAGLLFSSGKFFGLTTWNGNVTGRGGIYSWDPLTSIYSQRTNFANSTNSNAIYPNNQLLRLPAFVANSVLNTCANTPSITINSSNNNIWVPITDLRGDAVGEIKANGNNLGNVTTSIYINGGPVREDAQHRLYLDRNVTITPQTQPSTPVDIRLYLKKSEFEALRDATNSLNQPSGVTSIADLTLFKNSDPCGPVVVNSANNIPATAAQWGDNYVLSASISSFSSFYVKASAAVLPVTLTHFAGNIVQHDAILYWQTAAEQNMTGYEIERSTDGNGFVKIGDRITASNGSNGSSYQLRDPKVFDLIRGKIYYRLKMIENNGKLTYSEIAVLSLNVDKGTILYPNPASEQLFLEITLPGRIVEFEIVDLSGKIVRSEKRVAVTGRNRLIFSVSNLPKGIYFMRYDDGKGIQTKKFVKR